MRDLGRTGIRVSPYCLGTMMFGRVVVPATEVNGSVGEAPHRVGGSRRWIVTEVEHSLRRLDIGPLDVSCTPPAITRVPLRRRPADERAAA